MGMPTPLRFSITCLNVCCLTTQALRHNTIITSVVLYGCETWLLTHKSAQTRAGDPFFGCVPKLFIKFKEILSLAHGNFEDQNKVLEPSIIIINFCITIIIIHADYNYTVQLIYCINNILYF
jgi:hypothetical protein